MENPRIERPEDLAEVEPESLRFDAAPNRVVLVAGDRVRLTRPMVQTMIAALKRGDDRVVIETCSRGDDLEVHMKLQTEPSL